MQVDIEIAIEIARKTQLMRPRADIAHGGLSGFLHHVAEFSGNGELALAFHQRGFGGENLAAHFGPGEAGGGADFVLLLGLQIAELRGTKQFGQLIGCRQ